MKYLIAILMMSCLYLPAYGVLAADGKGWNWISPGSVQEMIREGSGLWMIDVRSTTAFDAGHIEGAAHIPASSLSYKSFPENKVLVLVDDSLGQKTAKEAAEILIRNANARVYILEGGFSFWRMDGHPVTGPGSLVLGVTPDEFKWAVANKVPVRVFDMRHSEKTGALPVVQGNKVEGNNVREKVLRIKEILKKEMQGDMAGLLEKPRPILLVFSAKDDGVSLSGEVGRELRADVRYLVGGHEALDAPKGKGPGGSCPLCPGGGK